MNRYLLFLIFPCIVTAGTMYYTDEPVVLTEPPVDPIPAEVIEDEQHINEVYFFHEKKDLKKTVFRKNSTYFDLNIGYSEFDVDSVRPHYYPQNKTEERTTSTVSPTDLTATTTSTDTIETQETFSINDLGKFTFKYPSDSAQERGKQITYEMNMVSRGKHVAFGFDIAYANCPEVELLDPKYRVFQTVTTTSASKTTDTAGTSTTLAPKTTVTYKDVPLTMDKVTLKLANIPMSFDVMVFPIYDGYFQPYLKACLGINLSHTDLQIEQYDSAVGTMIPLYQEGWGFGSWNFSFGGGFQLMLTESLAFTASYLQQNVDARSTKFQTTVSEPGKPASANNGPYGLMRFEVGQTRTVQQVGLVFYM